MTTQYSLHVDRPHPPPHRETLGAVLPGHATLPTCVPTSCPPKVSRALASLIGGVDHSSTHRGAGRGFPV